MVLLACGGTFLLVLVLVLTAGGCSEQVGRVEFLPDGGTKDLGLRLPLSPFASLLSLRFLCLFVSGFVCSVLGSDGRHPVLSLSLCVLQE